MYYRQCENVQEGVSAENVLLTKLQVLKISNFQDRVQDFMKAVFM